VLRELTKDGTTLRMLAGRYGPYVTDGTTNASIPRGTNPDAVTYEQAVDLLEARRNAAPSSRRGAPRRRAAGSRAGARGARSKSTGTQATEA
jgi:DNA topoisomerase I